MAKTFVPPDEAASDLARTIFHELNKGYVVLGEFRGKLATEIQRAAPGPLKKPLQDIDRLISEAQDDLDKAVEKMREIAPGTLLVTLGRKPHHLPGR